MDSRAVATRGTIVPGADRDARTGVTSIAALTRTAACDERLSTSSGASSRHRAL
jgi:hypothetical protein